MRRGTAAALVGAWCWWAVGFGAFSQGQAGPYAFSAGPEVWGTSQAEGLLGMGFEIEQDNFGLGLSLGIGTNRVQGWSVLPRVYFAPAAWRPFGELRLVQVSETSIGIDPSVGLVKEAFTWHFVGLGLGVSLGQAERSLQAVLGLGVNGGQCLPCGVQAYASLRIGFAFSSPF